MTRLTTRAMTQEDQAIGARAIERGQVRIALPMILHDETDAKWISWHVERSSVRTRAACFACEGLAFEDFEDVCQDAADRYARRLDLLAHALA